MQQRNKGVIFADFINTELISFKIRKKKGRRGRFEGMKLSYTEKVLILDGRAAIRRRSLNSYNRVRYLVFFCMVIFVCLVRIVYL
jgi:hypothetical protein